MSKISRTHTSMPRFPADKLTPKEDLKGLTGAGRKSVKKTAIRKSRAYLNQHLRLSNPDEGTLASFD